MKKFLWSLAAVLTTPEAIAAEKSLAVIVLGRLAILIPTAASVIYVAIHALS